MKKYPKRYGDFIFAGVPEKIIQAFSKKWPIEIVKKMIELFSKMVSNNEPEN